MPLPGQGLGYPSDILRQVLSVSIRCNHPRQGGELLQRRADPSLQRRTLSPIDIVVNHHRSQRRHLTEDLLIVRSGAVVHYHDVVKSFPLAPLDHLGQMLVRTQGWDQNNCTQWPLLSGGRPYYTSSAPEVSTAR